MCKSQGSMERLSMILVCFEQDRCILSFACHIFIFYLIPSDAIRTSLSIMARSQILMKQTKNKIWQTGRLAAKLLCQAFRRAYGHARGDISLSNRSSEAALLNPFVSVPCLICKRSARSGNAACDCGLRGGPICPRV